MLKSWILALAAIPLVAWLFARVLQQKVPTMVVDGTGQVIAQWRDSLLAFKADEGHFPKELEDRSFEQSMMDQLTGSNARNKHYLDRSAVIISHTLAVDGWDNALRFDPEETGDVAHIVSNGPDGKPNTPDDIDSRNVKLRNLPVPPDPNGEGKAKSKTNAAAPAATEAPAAPAAEPQP